MSRRIQLNPAQRTAVEHIDSPLLVLAGAGSGKTRVITEKIAWLVDGGHFPARRIAAITFTNKAAREMRERLRKRLGREAVKGLTVSTFHALGWRILLAEAEACGRRRGVSILDDGTCSDLVRELLPGQVDRELLFAVRRSISDFKDNGVTPEAARTLDADDNTARAAEVYGEYETRMRQLNAVDFDDLIARPAALLASDPEAATRWRRQWQYFLVDEYQDTSLAQYRLLRALVGEAGRFTAVGDDDQSIYGWRGARPENLSELGRDFPRLEVVKLEQNYRSAGNILRAANAVIAQNPHDYDKRLWSDLGPGAALRVVTAADEVEEAEGIARDLLAEHFGGRIRWRDAAVLYRSNFQSRKLEQALRENNIPYSVTGGPSWFDAREIRDALAYLRLLVNPEDNPAFLRVANTPRRGLGSTTLTRVGEYAANRGTSLFTAAVDDACQADLPPAGASALRNFTNLLIDVNDRAERGDPGEAYVDLINRIDYAGHLRGASDEVKQIDRRIKNLDDFVAWVRRLAGDTDSLPELLARVTLASGPSDDTDDPGDQVRLMTLHAAKGLEFPRVYLAGCEEGLLPHRHSLDEDRLEEERRLMYVGLTRAGRNLILSHCRQRRQGGENTAREPSRFLDEIPADILDWPERGQRAEGERVSTGERIADLKALLG